MTHTFKNFITQTDEAAIVDAIRKAESKTSGELRIHIENECAEDVYNHALEVFNTLKMNETKDANGVLIYVAVVKKEFVICGDKGINDKVGADFWNSTRDKIQTQFRQGNFAQGLIDGILESGRVLSEHFPWHPNDIDELDNSISKS